MEILENSIFNILYWLMYCGFVIACCLFIGMMFVIMWLFFWTVDAVPKTIKQIYYKLKGDKNGKSRNEQDRDGGSSGA